MMNQDERLQSWLDSWGHKCYHDWQPVFTASLSSNDQLIPTPVVSDGLVYYEAKIAGFRCTKCGAESMSGTAGIDK
jgi:hypothetical protein